MKSRAQIKKELRDEVPASDYVPFGAHIAPNLIKLRNHAGYLALWKVQGIAFETADPEDIKSRRDQLNNFLGTIGGGHYALWQHKIGRVVSERLPSAHTNPFCAEFDTRYYDSFSQYRMFSTELYVSIVFRPTLSKTANAFKSMRTSHTDYRESEKADIDQFDLVCKQVMNSLEPYDPTRLSTYVRDGVVCSALLQVYGYILNGVWEHVPLRTAAINQYLPAARLFFGDKNGLVQVRHPKAQRFAGLLDFQDYPSSTEPGMNNGICYGDYEYVETQSFSMLNKREALKNLDRQKKRLISTGDAAASEIDGITHAEDMVQSGAIQMGEYHYSLAIYGESIQDVIKNMASAKSALEDGPGYKVSAVDVVPEGAWFAQLPGNWSLRPRQATISSRNFASMAPMHNFPSGKRDGNPWGQAITVLKTPSGQPFFFNFHVSPPKRLSVDEKHPGNTTIIGTTGVGKTTLVMALVAFSRKVKGIRTVFFDKDRGAEIGIRAMGGNYRALIYGERTGFNPFQFEPTRTNIEFCKGLVRLLITGGSDKLTAREDEDISQAVDAVFSLPLKMRRLATVDQCLPGVGDNSLSQRLKKWIGHGDYAWVLDNPTDTTNLSTHDLFGFDYTEFLDRPEVRTPIMAYLLHVTEWLIDGRPFQYIMEEFWKPLMDPYFTDFALNKQKTIRKQFGLGIFLTQSPSDVLQHPIAKTMVEQSVTQIFLPNPRADHGDYVNGFKVSEQEFFVIKNLAENSRMFLVKQNGQAAIVKLDLGGMPDVINILSGALDNVALLERIRAEYGDDPAVWIPHFHAAIEDRKKLTITQ